MHEKSVSALIEHRGPEKARQMISDVHAISANIHNYRFLAFLEISQVSMVSK